MDFSFFVHRFFWENLRKFISLMGNALWVYGTLYKVKKATNFLYGEMWPANKLSGLEWFYCTFHEYPSFCCKDNCKKNNNDIFSTLHLNSMILFNSVQIIVQLFYSTFSGQRFLYSSLTLDRTIWGAPENEIIDEKKIHRKSMKILLTNGHMLWVPWMPSIYFRFKVQKTCSSDCLV